MGRRPGKWHVWHWDGEAFELVYFDLRREEATDIVKYNNDRAIDGGREAHYVMSPDDVDPTFA
jgi:hypothetical protein